MLSKQMCLLLSVFVLGAASASSQQAAHQTAGPRSLLLDVVVAPKSGQAMSGLQKSDFTLLDNGSPASIASFREVSHTQEPVKVIVVIDAVNINFDRVSYARDEVQKFLRASEGRLIQPTTLAVLTDKGMELEKSFTTDGNALSTSLNQKSIGLREITRSQGFWGADERLQISLAAMRQLTAYATTLPGRKIVLWVSPGWPLLSGPGVDLSGKQQQQIFGNVVAFSQQLQKANVTLYNINPLGPDESLLRSDYYRTFVNGVSSAKQTDLADLSLQVLAIQSGGLALNNNDVAGNIARCIDDTKSWYELTFDMPVEEKANQYHRLEIKVDKAKVTARTREGYYGQP